MPLEASRPTEPADTSRSLYLGTTRFSLTFDAACARAAVHLDRAWARCSAPRMPTRHSIEIAIALAPEGLSLSTDGMRRTVACEPSVAHWAAEFAMYRHLAEHPSPGVATLHAAGVVDTDGLTIFVGEADAGKSSLTLAALDRGARYLSDDVLFTDGSDVWGLARAVQFDRDAGGRERPRWLQRELEERPMSADPHDGVQPFYVPPPERVADHAALRDARVVRARRARPGEETSVRRVAPSEALTWLIAASYRPPVVDLGPALRVNRALDLVWTTPDEGLRAIEAASPNLFAGP